jgi:Glutamyl-tRNAGlu reductase, dimerisation domain
MSMILIAPPVDHRPAPVCEPSASLEEHDLSLHLEQPECTRATVEGSAAVRSAPPPHRRYAADMIRRLGGSTEATLRREVDRFLASRPGLSPADRAAIARAMSRFRNQLLHHPRRTLRVAAVATDPAGAHHLLDAVGRLFKLADDPPSNQADPRRPGDRRAKPSPKSLK